MVTRKTLVCLLRMKMEGKALGFWRAMKALKEGVASLVFKSIYLNKGNLKQSLFCLNVADRVINALRLLSSLCNLIIQLKIGGKCSRSSLKSFAFVAITATCL